MWGTSLNGSIEYVSYRHKDHYDGLLNVLRMSFYPYESAARATGLATDPEGQKETDDLVRNTIRDGVSIVAVEKNSRKVVGVAVNKIQIRSNEGEPYFEIFARTCKHASSQGLIRFMKKADEACDLFELFKIDCLLELMFLAVLPEYGNKGIGTKLSNYTVEIARSLSRGKNLKVAIDDVELTLEPVPQLVAALFTSSTSQRVADKCGFEVAARISYDQFFINGKTFASILGDSERDTTLAFKRL